MLPSATMPNKEQFNDELDDIPACAPYEVVQNLRTQHWLLHRANLRDELLPHSPCSFEELAAKLRNLKPTTLSDALELEHETIIRCGSGQPEWAVPALKIAIRLRRDHIPPESISHDY